MNNGNLRKTLSRLVRELKPWILAVLLLLVLRYSGALGTMAFYTQKAVMVTGVMAAEPPETPSRKTAFDYNFSIQTLGNEEVDFSGYKGKTVFLNLWATWCGPCRAEMPSIQKLYNKVNQDSIAFVMLSLDRPEDVGKVKKYVASNGFTFPVFMAGDLPDQLQVEMIPSTFIISPQGEVVFSKSGMADYAGNKFARFLEKVSREPAQP